MTDSSSARGLLEGIRVIDLTNVLAGPFCTYQLGLQGADVLKVELPEKGDLARQLGADRLLNECLIGSSFLAQNAGKRSMTLNLKDDRGKAVFRQLLAKTDVLVENFRPGVLESLGFSWEHLREHNPRLIYCQISGFGSDGPMAHRPAYDQIVQGLAGMMEATGYPDGDPTRVGFPICDILGGMTAAFAIASAITARSTSGRGSYLDVSMLDAALTGLGWAASNWLIADEPARRMGNDNFTASPSGAFETKAGFLNIAANQQSQFVALCNAIDRPDLLDDDRFFERSARLEHRDALNAVLLEALASRTASEWELVLNAVGIPAAAVLSVKDALELDQVVHRKVVADLGIVAGMTRPLRVLTAGFHVDGTPAKPSRKPPLLGADTTEQLESLGYTSEQIAGFARDGVI